ncbi:isochorismatase family cysteine hydrolase [Nocardia sp. NPDC005998]|uniref:isochorismatase family cysteine hydrolase n=1 Tax=Nocardia sp. NPDC005998 TaxID=3156894 RepID=UPI0033B8144F
MSTDNVTTALIVCDVQTGIIDNFAFARPVVPILAAAIPAARSLGVRIIYLRAALRANGSDVHPNNTLFQQFHEMGTVFHENSDETHINEQFEIYDTDIIVLKRRTSGFAATDLDLILRSNDIDHLVLCGVATSAVVAATVYAASDLDYRISVLSDACADQDPDVHEFLTRGVFPGRGVQVLTTDDWLAALAGNV